MTLLAIDTATDEAAVAVRQGGRTAERALGARSAFRMIGPAIGALLDEAGIEPGGLDGIAVPAGPGSFTGLRIGASLALGLAEPDRIPLFAPSTLIVVAEACAPRDAEIVCASLDARRGRRYAGVCARRAPGAWDLVDGPIELDPRDLAGLARGLPMVALEGSTGRRPSPASALARLVDLSPDCYRLDEPHRLGLRYVRPGVDRTA